MVSERHRKGNIGSLFLAITLVFWLLALAGPGEAVPIASFTGNTFMEDGGVDGTVNYAVFTKAAFSADATAILSSFVAGTGSSGLDLTGSGFVYLFQVANNGADTLAISTLSVPFRGYTPTSWGYFLNKVFTDPAGLLVRASNNLGDDTTPAGGSSPRVGVDEVGFATLTTGVVNPSSVDRLSASVKGNFSGEIPSGETSSLLVYTATAPETYLGLTGTIVDGGTSASGFVPSPSPEPSTLLLLGSGLLGAAAWARHRSLKKRDR